LKPFERNGVDEAFFLEIKGVHMLKVIGSPI